MAAKIKSQPNKPATPIENVRGSTIARTPQTKTTTAEAINHRLARFTSISTLPDSRRLFTTPRSVLLMIAIEQHFDTSHADHDNSYYHRKLRCRSWISEHKRLATLSCASGSEVIEQRHKTKVHVNLLMAV